MAALGCTTAKPLGTSGASVSGASSVGTSSGGSSGGSSQGTGTTTGASSTGSSGTTTGPIPSPYFDGGYVFCAGNVGDGGLSRWMCQPGTYFCDLGARGICSQCRGDADCADPSLPTYDPRRQRCDLDSGVPGYQGFCQQCTADSNCLGSLEGTKCDLDPKFPSDAVQPPIVTLGFEACGPLETDCRRLDGPLCRESDQRCNQANGRCEDFPDRCLTDLDCQGEFARPYRLQPFCVDGVCEACDSGLCPYDLECFSDADCGNPDSLATGLRCDPQYGSCACTDSSQCSGVAPACLGLDGGRFTPDGGPEGSCGCSDTSQCGDGGLICIPISTSAFDTSITVSTFGAGARCGVPCTSPLSPTCRWLTFGDYDSCDPATGLCAPCIYGHNEECMDSLGAGGPTCFYFGELPPPEPGFCGCVVDSDCPYGYACSNGDFGGQGVGSCIPALPRCTKTSCGNAFCNFESGQCTQDAGHAGGPSACVSDHECRSDQVCNAGSCLGCATNGDCLAHGPTNRTLCCHIDADCYENGYLPNTCASYCHTDNDCAGNSAGSKCEIDAGSDSSGAYFQCGCGSDSDCSGNPSGTHCVSEPTDPQLGACLCESSADCAAGSWCYGESCTNSCFGSASCSDDFPCGPRARCQARCDGQHACPASAPICDTGNAVGLNGEWLDGEDAGPVVWCYQCLDGRDCPGGLGCRFGTCAACIGQSDCHLGSVCASDGLCHATCDAGLCPAGEVCDWLDRAGSGSNVCYACASPADCPNGQGCDSRTHTCGTCEGPTAVGGPYDCPPDAVCSSYGSAGVAGACLQNCDRVMCPASAPICTVLPDLTPDHSYCFECLSDLDCEDGGWCDKRFYACKRADEP